MPFSILRVGGSAVAVASTNRSTVALPPPTPPRMAMRPRAAGAARTLPRRSNDAAGETGAPGRGAVHQLRDGAWGWGWWRCPPFLHRAHE